MPRWLLWSFAAVVFWGVWAVVFEPIKKELTAMQGQALSTLGLVPVMIVLACSRRPSAAGNQRKGIFIAFAGGLLSAGGNIAYYHAIQLGGKAATVAPLTALYPLVTVSFALLLLRERLSALQIAGIPLSLAAMWLFDPPQVTGLSSGWLAYVLIPILLWGLTGLLQKVCTLEISGELSTLWFLAAFIPVGAAILLFLDPIENPIALGTWLLVVLLGLSYGLGNFALLMAFARGGKASVLTPLTGLYPAVSVPLAILFFGQQVTAREWAGIGLALISVVALSWERRRTQSG